MFIKIGKESNIFRFEVPKEAYAAYLTDGQENNAIMAIYNKTGSMEEAIKIFTNSQLKDHEKYNQNNSIPTYYSFFIAWRCYRSRTAHV
tara:strand:+ start:3640 stop:3906 length:267 start_codon:yes stop_codon:yes gene_type:complete